MGTSITSQMTYFVGSDSQVREAGEQRMASFSVAISRKNRAVEKLTLWGRVNCWNKLADIEAQYVKKGSLVQVTAEWLRPVGVDRPAQASVDMDASRLVLLNRAANGDHGSDDGDSNIPF